MPVAWRLVKSRYVDGAFDGEGARRSGGRWTSPGHRVAHASERASLAVLEVLVHVRAPEVLPSFAVCSVDLPDEWIALLDASRLPAGWRSHPHPPALRELGDAWIAEARSPVLAVPSVIVPWERNYLVNLEHPDCRALAVRPPQPFELDPRLGAGRES